MKCEFCDIEFNKGVTQKIIRGKKHIFCSEYCYVLYHYRIPKFPIDRSYGPSSISFPASDFKELNK